jgi:hypothetical protein
LCLGFFIDFKFVILSVAKDLLFVAGA